MLLASAKFEDICRNSTIFLDTNIFIYAHENSELLSLIADLTSKNNVAFVTISSVEHEFSRGSQSIDEIKTRKDFVRGIVSRVMPVGPLLENDNNEAFSVAMSLTVSRKDSQYTDYLIAVALHKYSLGSENQFVLSADVAAFPRDIFTIEGVISVEIAKNKLVHLNLIRLDGDKYEAVARRIANT